MSAESPVASFLPLRSLLEEKNLPIADLVFIASSYSEIYYIDRTLCLQKYIKEDIFMHYILKDVPELIASTEQEIRQFCHMNPYRNKTLAREGQIKENHLAAIARKIRNTA